MQLSIIMACCSAAERERARRENKTVSANQNSLKILYAPYTNLTLSIIKKANRTFETAGDLIALADQVANCSQFFLDNFHPAQLETVSKVNFLSRLREINHVPANYVAATAVHREWCGVPPVF